MVVSHISLRRKLLFMPFVITVVFGSVPAMAKQVNIDFESIPTNTLLRNFRSFETNEFETHSFSFGAKFPLLSFLIA